MSRITVTSIGCLVGMLALVGLGCGPGDSAADEERADALERGLQAAPPVVLVEIRVDEGDGDAPVTKCTVSNNFVILSMPGTGSPGAPGRIEWALEGPELADAAAEILGVGGTDVFRRVPADPPTQVRIPAGAIKSPPQTPARTGTWVYEVVVTKGGQPFCDTDPEVCVRGSGEECIPRDPDDDDVEPPPT